MKSPSNQKHHWTTGPLPLSAPDRSQKEPLRGKFERTTHLWHQRAPWAMEIKSNINPSTQGVSPWIIGEWVTWENTFMPMFFGWKTNYLNIYRYIIPFWLKDNLFESLNHDSLQSRANESSIRKVEEPTSRYWRTIRFLENEHEQWELKNFNMSATQRNNMEHIQPSQLKQTSLIIVIHSDS